MKHIRTAKKWILQAEKLIIDNNLSEARTANAKASKVLEKCSVDESVEILKNKLIRQHNEITVCMIKSLSPNAYNTNQKR
jgi:hypothetical protein